MFTLDLAKKEPKDLLRFVLMSELIGALCDPEVETESLIQLPVPRRRPSTVVGDVGEGGEDGWCTAAQTMPYEPAPSLDSNIQAPILEPCIKVGVVCDESGASEGVGSEGNGLGTFRKIL